MLTAGTGDAAVAEECRRTAELMGCYVFRLQVRFLFVLVFVATVLGLPPTSY